MKTTNNYIVPKIMNGIVLLLSIGLIVWISMDTFKKIDFLKDHLYMTFQFFMCMFFILDFFVELHYHHNKRRFFKQRIVFLLLSIPYLNIVNLTGITLSPEALYFIRFIPLARGALAMSIVIGYLSNNAITSIFMSYIAIIITVTYFCSLILFEREYPVNPEINSYWTTLWWSFMNLTTVGCSIVPVTPAGKVIVVLLPICGMIMFPLFTVYLTNFVTDKLRNPSWSFAPTSNSPNTPSPGSSDTTSTPDASNQK